MRPAKWSMVVLKTWPQNGASGAAFRSVSRPPMSFPFTSRLSGPGKTWTASSSISRTPMPPFEQATATGRNLCAAAPAATPRRISSGESAPPSRYFPSSSSSDSAAASTSAVRSRSASAFRSAGTSASVHFAKVFPS